MSHMGKILEEVGKIVLEWGSSNVVIYSISKIEAILFSKSQKLASQLSKTRLHFGRQAISFNNK